MRRKKRVCVSHLETRQTWPSTDLQMILHLAAAAVFDEEELVNVKEMAAFLHLP